MFSTSLVYCVCYACHYKAWLLALGYELHMLGAYCIDANPVLQGRGHYYFHFTDGGLRIKEIDLLGVELGGEPRSFDPSPMLSPMPFGEGPQAVGLGIHSACG